MDLWLLCLACHNFLISLSTLIIRLNSTDMNANQVLSKWFNSVVSKSSSWASSFHKIGVPSQPEHKSSVSHCHSECTSLYIMGLSIPFNQSNCCQNFSIKLLSLACQCRALPPQKCHFHFTFEILTFGPGGPSLPRGPVNRQRMEVSHEKRKRINDNSKKWKSIEAIIFAVYRPIQLNGKLTISPFGARTC